MSKPYNLPTQIEIKILDNYVWVSDYPEDEAEQLCFDKAIAEYLEVFARDGKAVLVGDWMPAPQGGIRALRDHCGYASPESIPF